MLHFISASILLALVLFVIIRVQIMKQKGIDAFKFGVTNQRDFLIPPFALIYFYLILARAFGWPFPYGLELPLPDSIGWLGIGLGCLGIAGLAISLISFKTSFRVGIDEKTRDALVTGGIFALSRNPIYVSFALVLLGQLAVSCNAIFALYGVAGCWLFHRQVLQEEVFLRSHYGDAYLQYCQKVRRYL